MKKTTALLIALFIGMFNASYAVKKVTVSPQVLSGINKYKAGNYLGASQDIKTAIDKNPNDSLALYYLGNVYTKIGKKEEAKDSYKKVVELNEYKGLTKYAGVALVCLEAPPKTVIFNNPVAESVGAGNTSGPMEDNCTKAVELLKTASDKDGISEFIRSGEFLHTDAAEKVKDNSMKGVQEAINSGDKNVDFAKFRYLNDATNSDPMNGEKMVAAAASIDMPSDKEIADAVKTLAKVGFNPLNFNSQQGFNPHLAQMNYYSPSQNNNNSFDMLPFLMSQQNNRDSGNLNPQLIQNMMMNQMLPSYDFSNTSKGY